MGLKVTERIISMQHMKLVLLHYVFAYWSWSNDESIARVYVRLSTPNSCDIKINVYYYDTNVIYARAKFCSFLFSI